MLGRWRSTPFLSYYIRPQVLKWMDLMAQDMARWTKFLDLTQRCHNNTTSTSDNKFLIVVTNMAQHIYCAVKPLPQGKGGHGLVELHNPYLIHFIP